MKTEEIKKGTNSFIPSIQLAELFYHFPEDDLISIVERVISIGYYQSVESLLPENKDVREKIRKILKLNNIRWTCWATRFINTESLNIGNINEIERKKSTQRHKELIDLAAECGADSYAFFSGQRPYDINLLSDSIKAAEASLCELADYSKQYKNLSLMLEALDVNVHKKNTIGNTSVATKIIHNARNLNPNTYLVWDSAHFALMKEDLRTSLRNAKGVIGQIHLCNAILDSDDSLYGDYHIEPGSNGFLTTLRAADIIQAAKTLNLGDNHLPIAVEVRPAKDETPWIIEEKTRKMLEQASLLANGSYIF